MMSVKCRDCGYLAHRSGGMLCEVQDADGHRDGRAPFMKCFVRRPDFQTDSDSITKERECDDFTPWVQGFSPKEHFEMNVMERLRAQDMERTKLDQQWRERQDSRDFEWRERMAEREREWRREDVSLAKTNMLVAAGIGFISALATLIAAKLLPWF